MLDFGVSLVARTRTVGYVEREAFAASTLLARMADQSLEPAPVFCGDLARLDAREFAGTVDMVVAGLPCQPYSPAGKRAGNTDRRSWGSANDGPIPHALRIIRECDPWLVFFENVPQWVSLGHFEPVRAELHGLGFTVETPLTIGANDVGASHQRRRVFVLGHRVRSGWRKAWRDYTAAPERPASAGAGLPAQVVANTVSGERASGAERSRRTARANAGGGCAVSELGFADGKRQQTQSVGPPELVPAARSDLALGDSAVQRIRTESAGQAQDRLRRPFDPRTDLFAPGREPDLWRAIVADAPHLAPAIEPGFRGVVDGLAYVVDEHRADRLRAIGNGVVPLQAAIAFHALCQQAGLGILTNQEIHHV